MVRPVVLTVGILAMIAGLVIAALSLGAVEVGRDIIGLRLPRLFLALAVGVNFAVAGAIVQVVLRNPLAEPGVLGISAGASLAVVCAIFLGGTSAVYAPFWALVGGGLAGVAILSLWSTNDPARLILGGVMVGLILNALVMSVIVGFGAGRAELALLWLVGSLYGRGYDALWPVLAAAGFALAVLPFFLRPLGALRFEDDTARSIGVDVRRWRIVTLALAVILAASAVSAVGPIGFVGLVVPHFARLLVGTGMAAMLWVTALSGAALTLLADTVGRAIAPPLEVPVGAVTALIGAPVFIYLLLRGKTR